MKINLDTTKNIKQYESEIAKLKAIQSKLPKDYICARKKAGRYFFYNRERNSEGKVREHYIPTENAKYIKECCEARYLSKLIPALEKELKAIKSFERKYKPQTKSDVWHKLPPALQQHVAQRFQTKAEACIAWEKAGFETNPFPLPEYVQYMSKKGEAVRSRIELIIADMLYDLGISYRYECRLDLASGTIYPDFTIMDPNTLEIFYIEIFGMMDDAEYAKNAFSKIAKYTTAGLLPNLIMFFDHKDAPISPVQIKSTLIKMFLN